jgi:hypothetical protein
MRQHAAMWRPDKEGGRPSWARARVYAATLSAHACAPIQFARAARLDDSESRAVEYPPARSQKERKGLLWRSGGLSSTSVGSAVLVELRSALPSPHLYWLRLSRHRNPVQGCASDQIRLCSSTVVDQVLAIRLAVRCGAERRAGNRVESTYHLANKVLAAASTSCQVARSCRDDPARARRERRRAMFVRARYGDIASTNYSDQRQGRRDVRSLVITAASRYPSVSWGSCYPPRPMPKTRKTATSSSAAPRPGLGRRGAVWRKLVDGGDSASALAVRLSARGGKRRGCQGLPAPGSSRPVGGKAAVRITLAASRAVRTPE